MRRRRFEGSQRTEGRSMAAFGRLPCQLSLLHRGDELTLHTTEGDD
jgi:hypothetical protein